MKSSAAMFTSHCLAFFFKASARMGHACTKDANAEKIERRRVERERRLGLVRQSPSTPLQQPAGLVPNGMWPRGTAAPSTLSNQGRGTLAFQPGRSSQPTQIQLPPAQAQYMNPQQFAAQLPPMHHQPRAVLRTPERPRGTGPNPNSPFNDPRHRPGLLEGPHQVEDHSGILKPIVVQALNQLCAIELQARALTINEEIWGRNELLIELEQIQELEAFRAATQELFALEGRSRVSIVGHQLDSFRSLLEAAGESMQEARLTGLIRETQERHLQSRPTSAHVTPIRHRPPSRPQSPIHATVITLPAQNSRHRSELGWTPEVALHSTSKQISPPRPIRSNYSNLSDIADRVLSQEEEALNAKIARQRGLIDSTRSLYHVHVKSIDAHRAPLRAAPTLPQPSPTLPALKDSSFPIRAAPIAVQEATSHHNPSNLTLREASFEATRNRISALSYYQ